MEYSTCYQDSHDYNLPGLLFLQEQYPNLYCIRFVSSFETFLIFPFTLASEMRLYLTGGLFYYAA